MIKCQACGAEAREVSVPYYVEKLMGVSIGLIDSVKKVECQACGEETITIPDVEGLIAAAAVFRATIPTRLNGVEIKFLRKAIELSAKDLAELLDVRPETISRWENDHENIPVAPDKLFRQLVGFAIKEHEGKDRAPAIYFEDQAILKMTINPLRLVNDRPLMEFERIKVKVENQKQVAWDGEPVKAAVNF